MTVPEEVFVPTNPRPGVTYVFRPEAYEERLGRLLRRRGAIIGITGPSKSGKTALILRVLQDRRACWVKAALTRKPSDVWAVVRDSLQLPVEQAVERQDASGSSASTGVSGGVSALVRASASRVRESELSTTFGRVFTYRTNVLQIIETLIREGYVLVIDDFHYLPQQTRRVLSKHIKAASDLGLTTILSSITHRGDDPIRANADLVGRVRILGIRPWNPDELVPIAIQGFGALNAVIDPEVFQVVARESAGSPQLMQLFCLELCTRKGIESELVSRTDVDVTGEDLKEALMSSAEDLGFEPLCEVLEAGPRERGRREVFQFGDRSFGSVYKALLKGISADPLMVTMNYATLQTRIRSLFGGARGPSGHQITEAARKMSEIAARIAQDGRPRGEQAVEWLEERDTLVVPDPYFLHFLRWERYANQRSILLHTRS